jgi:hypothetical protein
MHLGRDGRLCFDGGRLCICVICRGIPCAYFWNHLSQQTEDHFVASTQWPLGGSGCSLNLVLFVGTAQGVNHTLRITAFRPISRGD